MDVDDIPPTEWRLACQMIVRDEDILVEYPQQVSEPAMNGPDRLSYRSMLLRRIAGHAGRGKLRRRSEPLPAGQHHRRPGASQRLPAAPSRPGRGNAIEDLLADYFPFFESAAKRSAVRIHPGMERPAEAAARPPRRRTRFRTVDGRHRRHRLRRRATISGRISAWPTATN